MNISDILFLGCIIAIVITGAAYLLRILLISHKNYSNIREDVLKEAREKHEQKRREFDEMRMKSQQDFDSAMADLNKRNRETIERIREHLRRLQEAEIRRAAEEARRRASAMTQEKQKLLVYMNVVGISNYPFTREEISKKRRVLSLKYHPDRNGGKDDKMKKVNEACDYLEKIAQG